MADIITLLFRHFWVLAIGINILNARIIWARVQGEIRENPALAPGYRTLTNGYAFWTSIPWVVMGIGILEGGVPHLFHYLRPADGNPYVLAYWAAIFLVYDVATTYWLFWEGGLEMLEKHPGFLTRRALLSRRVPLSRRQIKIRWLIQIVASVAAFVYLHWLDLSIGEPPL